jgi:predicted XRE-type DNA-binding protein
MFSETLFSELKRIVLTQFSEMASRTEEATSARCIISTLLYESGLTDREIARLMGVTRQSVNKLRQTFILRERYSWSFRQKTCEIRKEFALYCQRIELGSK